MKFTVAIPAAHFEAAMKQAKRNGYVNVQEWLQYEAEKAITRRLRGDDDLSPKDARAQLGIGKRRFELLSQSGAFPHLYHVNSRVVRVPQVDLDAYKARRQRFITDSRQENVA